MKKLTLLFLFIISVLFITGCSKDTPVTNSNNNNNSTDTVFVYKKIGLFDSIPCDTNVYLFNHFNRLGILQFDSLYQYKIEFNYKANLLNGKCSYDIATGGIMPISFHIISGGNNEFSYDSNYHFYFKQFSPSTWNDSLKFISTISKINSSYSIQGHIVFKNVRIYRN
ncbi:MAG: hypothetical protein NTU73_06935 [Ignavibacteriae bacterium]|nr:hypothetical protein [Ignavibacteriota bacterium]